MQLLVLGANSDIGFAVAKQFAQKAGADIYLASRNQEGVQRKAQDLAIRYQVKATPLYFDATDFASHAAFYEALDPKPHGIVAAFGHLGSQKKAQNDFTEARRIIETNYLGLVSILEVVAADFEKRGSGFIIGISSVAGERGRQSNYVYGSAKGAVSVYLSGLRNRLHGRNVHVLTVLPGFVRTKMTEGMDLPQNLLAEPEDVAAQIYKAHMNKDVIYCKPVWRLVMFVIRSIPELLFKRMRL